MLKKFFARSGSGGQLLVLYGLLLPIIFLFAGAVFDFGWWYFNLSKLQNAADAAVIAGAYKVREDVKRLKDYTKVTFISEKDNNLLEFLKLKQTATNPWIIAPEGDASDYHVSYVDAKKYLNLNMQEISNIKLEAPAAALIEDSKKDTDNIYYKVILSGEVGHIFGFMNERFGGMPLKAVAVAKLTEMKGEDLWTHIQLLKDGQKDPSGKVLKEAEVIYDWERTAKERLDAGDKSVDAKEYANRRTVRTTNGTNHDSRQISYVAGNSWRTEEIVLDEETGNNVTLSEVNNHDKLMTNTGDGFWRLYSKEIDNKKHQYLMDDMFIDFRPDIVYNSKAANGPIFTEDWDITNPVLEKMSFQHVTDTKKGTDLRIISTINFNKAYEVRATSDADGNTLKDSHGNDMLPTDPLYIRIESEPIYNDGITDGHSSVRQIIININPDPDDPDRGYNTYIGPVTNSLGEEMMILKYRPLVIFYDGPEKLNRDLSTVRDSLPVIINLNADFRGIIAMENSPVVINGNGHKFYGFVVAKEFVHTMGEDDFKNALKYTADGKEYLILKDELKTQDEIAETLKKETGNQKIFYKDETNGELYSIVKNSNVKDASDYDTTSYIRAKKKFSGSTDSNAGKAVYVLGSLTVNDFKMVQTDNWYEFTTKDFPDKSRYCIDGRDSKILLSYEGWTIITDVAGKQWLVKNPGSQRTLYPSFTVDGIKKYLGDRYYTTYTMHTQNNNNKVYVDPKGNVKYQDTPIKPKHNDDYRPYMADEDNMRFDYKDDFNLSESHYDRFAEPNTADQKGVVPARGICTYLDEGSSDNFFTIERATNGCK